jgi:very-short-patch-repair endonuclease
VVSRGQLLDAGMSADTIDWQLRRGRLHRLHRGVYAVGHAAVTHEGRLLAAVLACGPSAVLSHRSAAGVWRLLRPEPAAPIDVTVTTGHRRPRAGIRVHHATVARRVRDGLPVTSPVRTLVDMAATGDRHLDRAVEQALIARLVRSAELAATGSPALRNAASNDPHITRSEAERVLLGLIERAGLPPPQTNVRVAGHEVDAYWPHSRVVVEVDGFAFHAARHAFERDRLRDQRLAAAGLRVLRITWRQLIFSPEGVAVRLAGALSAA